MSILRGEEIRLFGELTEEKASEVVEKILKLKEEGKEKVTFIIDSKDGNFSAYTKIKNIIEVTGIEVDTICIGFAFSTAACIFLLGKNRIMYGKDSKISFHEPYVKISGNYSTLLERLEEFKEQYDWVMDAIYATFKSRFFTEIDVKQEVRNEWFLASDEALRYGFATDVVEKL